MTFAAFIWKDQTNRHLLLSGAAISAVLFAFFKILYPYPDFFSDSYFYIFSASANLDVSIWPIGYSKFLALLHKLTESATLTTAVQYLLIQFAALYLFFTILYNLKPSKKLTRTIFIFLIPNLLSLFLSNTISSDALFTALSIAWIAEIIWLLYHPKWYRLVTHGILLFLCFAVRNNAYYYPVITVLVLVLVKRDLWFKTTGILLPSFLIVPFIFHTREIAFKMTGTRQFSLFTGWQLANNALYLFPSIRVAPKDLTSPAARDIDRIYKVAFANIEPADLRHHLDYYVGNFFIREPASPLKQYFAHHYHDTTEQGYIASWGKASAEYEVFGKSILKHHPAAFLKNFVIPNAWHYLVPPLSHLQEYNYGETTIDKSAQFWFKLKSPTISCIFPYCGGILILYTTIFFLLNVFYPFQLITAVRLSLISQQPLPGSLAHLVALTLIVLNFAFSILTTQSILRYQVFPMTVLFISIGLLREYQVNTKLNLVAKTNSQSSFAHPSNSAFQIQTHNQLL